jgi:hypothetical protein
MSQLKTPPNNTNTLPNTHSPKVNILQKFYNSHQIDQTVSLLSACKCRIAVALREQEMRD